MTAIMQSSSATVGILQALSMQGLVPIDSAFYIILGQNIGAVIPVIISSVGADKAAKQVGIIHLLFNLIGCTIFIVLLELVPVNKLLSFTDNNSLKISLFHIIFNTASTVLLLPFTDYLIRISEKISSPEALKIISTEIRA